jgi:hypothetical protein
LPFLCFRFLLLIRPLTVPASSLLPYLIHSVVLSYDRSVASSFCSLSYDRSVASSFCSLVLRQVRSLFILQSLLTTGP